MYAQKCNNRGLVRLRQCTREAGGGGGEGREGLNAAWPVTSRAATSMLMSYVPCTSIPSNDRACGLRG